MIPLGERPQRRSMLRPLYAAPVWRIGNADSRIDVKGFAAQVEFYIERERLRIAREIHDELGGVLTGISACINVARHRAAESGGTPDQHLAQAAALTSAALETVQKIATDLRPGILAHMGIWDALKWYANRWAARTAVDSDCRISAEAALVALDAEQALAIFRIVQEAMTNIERHAQARQVCLRADLSGKRLIVSVADDGIGMPGSQPDSATCWGIRGMTERAQLLCGALSVGVNGARGTLVLLQVPLERCDEH